MSGIIPDDGGSVDFPLKGEIARESGQPATILRDRLHRSSRLNVDGRIFFIRHGLAALVAATIDYIKQSRANAYTSLVKARADPATNEIRIVHRLSDGLPEMAPFRLAEQDAMRDGTCISIYRRD